MRHKWPSIFRSKAWTRRALSISIAKTAKSSPGKALLRTQTQGQLARNRTLLSLATQLLQQWKSSAMLDLTARGSWPGRFGGEASAWTRPQSGSNSSEWQKTTCCLRRIETTVCLALMSSFKTSSIITGTSTVSSFKKKSKNLSKSWTPWRKRSSLLRLLRKVHQLLAIRIQTQLLRLKASMTETNHSQNKRLCT